MRICFTSDLHGRLAHYDQLTAVLQREAPDLLILGGDMLPDGAVTGGDSVQRDFVAQELLPRLRAWREQCGGFDVALIAGNHDERQTVAHLQKLSHEAAQDGWLTLLRHDAISTIRGVDFVGYGCSPPTPHWLKDFERLDTPDDAPPADDDLLWGPNATLRMGVPAAEHYRSHRTIAADLADMPIESGKTIFVCHAPPHESALDRLPHIDWPIGSRAVRAWIGKHHPAFALHGHVHESPMVSGRYVDELGGAVCINPGQGEAELHAVLLDTDDVRGTLRHTVMAPPSWPSSA